MLTKPRLSAPVTRALIGSSPMAEGAAQSLYVFYFPAEGANQSFGFSYPIPMPADGVDQSFVFYAPPAEGVDQSFTWYTPPAEGVDQSF